MPHLQTLDGRPLTWEQVHERVARYWETHERDGSLKPVPPAPTCSECRYGKHARCAGWMIHNRRRVPCECARHAR